MLVHLEGRRSRPDAVVLFAIFFVSCVLVAECRAGHQALFMCVCVCAFRCFVFVSSLSVLADLYIIVFKLGHGFRSCCYNWYSHSKLSGGRTCKCEPSPYPMLFQCCERPEALLWCFQSTCIGWIKWRQQFGWAIHARHFFVRLEKHLTVLRFFLNTFLFLSWHTPPFFASPFLFFFLIVVHRLFLCSCWLEGGRLWCC